VILRDPELSVRRDFGRFSDTGSRKGGFKRFSNSVIVEDEVLRDFRTQYLVEDEILRDFSNQVYKKQITQILPQANNSSH